MGNHSCCWDASQCTCSRNYAHRQWEKHPLLSAYRSGTADPCPPPPLHPRLLFCYLILKMLLSYLPSRTEPEHPRKRYWCLCPPSSSPLSLCFTFSGFIEQRERELDFWAWAFDASVITLSLLCRFGVLGVLFFFFPLSLSRKGMRNGGSLLFHFIGIVGMWERFFVRAGTAHVEGEREEGRGRRLRDCGGDFFGWELKWSIWNAMKADVTRWPSINGLLKGLVLLGLLDLRYLASPELPGGDECRSDEALPQWSRSTNPPRLLVQGAAGDAAEHNWFTHCHC